MILKVISETEYEVTLYDWTDRSEDYVAGYIKREPDPMGVDYGEPNEKHFWMFYPITQTPINCGDLQAIYTKLSDLNGLIGWFGEVQEIKYGNIISLT